MNNEQLIIKYIISVWYPNDHEPTEYYCSNYRLENGWVIIPEPCLLEMVQGEQPNTLIGEYSKVNPIRISPVIPVLIEEIPQPPKEEVTHPTQRSVKEAE